MPRSLCCAFFCCLALLIAFTPSAYCEGDMDDEDNSIGSGAYVDINNDKRIESTAVYDGAETSIQMGSVTLTPSVTMMMGGGGGDILAIAVAVPVVIVVLLVVAGAVAAIATIFVLKAKGNAVTKIKPETTKIKPRELKTEYL